MIKITFRGKEEPIFVDDVKGQRVWDEWLAGNKARIVVDNMAFIVSDIKNIVKVEKTQAELAQKPTRQEDEYMAFRRKMLALSLESRAEIIRIAKLIWSSHTKKEMPDDIKNEIKKRQLAYFKQHPNCIYANPTIYRDLIPEKGFDRGIDELEPIQNIVTTSLLRMIQNNIQTDLIYAGKAS